MTKSTDLGRLLALRQRSVTLAGDQLARCVRARQAQEHAFAQARDRVARHAAQARIAERGLVAAVIGRPLSAAALARFQGNRDIIGFTATELRTAAAAAEAGLAARVQAQAAARQAWCDCRHAADRLHLAMEHLARAAARRAEALAEARDEDRPHDVTAIAGGIREPAGPRSADASPLHDRHPFTP
jgi:hypothetical protein